MQTFSVTQFITYVNDTFKAIWDPTQVAVEGEVTGFRISQGQWVNFDLKDEDGLVSVFMVLRNLGVPIQDGMRVRLYGYPRIYPKYGKFSFSADRVEIVGEGGLRKALELLRQKLEAEGLFDLTRKRTLPRFPRRIALVASKESAAYGDFIRIVNERWSGIEIDVYHVLVQGRDAPESIVSALQAATSSRPSSARRGVGPSDPPPYEEPALSETKWSRTGGVRGGSLYDVIVITRGGGSLEELMAFNDERVVRAVYASIVPTLVGIGHERDITLAEEVADVRGSTPTDCARRLVPDKRDILHEIAALEETAVVSLESLIQDRLHRIERAFAGADRWLQAVTHRLAICQGNLQDAVSRWHERLKHQVETLERVIKSADPELILRRGYALVTSADGQVIAHAAEAKSGADLSLRFADGKVEVQVKKPSNNLRLF